MNPPRKNLITQLLAGESAVMFMTECRAGTENDVIHCAAGPAVRFGTCDSPGNPRFFNAMTQPSPDPSTMIHRYKLFLVAVSSHLPGAVRIIPDNRSIGALLHDLIQAGGGAAGFGVECPSFAWFLSGGYFHLLFHEADAHFNLDLAMKQLSALPGRPVMDFFPPVMARMTRDPDDLAAHLRLRGMTTEASGPGLPHGGMEGSLMRPDDAEKPLIFATPSLPNLDGADTASGETLMDLWFRQIQDILRALKSIHGRVNVAFRSGGTVEVPSWFDEWCRDEGIVIEDYEWPESGHFLIRQISIPRCDEQPCHETPCQTETGTREAPRSRTKGSGDPGTIGVTPIRAEPGSSHRRGAGHDRGLVT